MSSGAEHAIYIYLLLRTKISHTGNGKSAATNDPLCRSALLAIATVSCILIIEVSITTVDTAADTVVQKNSVVMITEVVCIFTWCAKLRFRVGPYAISLLILALYSIIVHNIEIFIYRRARSTEKQVVKIKFTAGSCQQRPEY